MEKLYDCTDGIEQLYGLQGFILGWLCVLIAVAVVAYLLGCFNGAVIVSKYILHNDVRRYGSGNAGLTNFYRVFGGPLTAVVILTDVVKAVLAVLIGGWVAAALSDHGALEIYGKLWAGLFCMLGHAFPCMFNFKGGKAVLSGGIVAFMVDWRAGVIAWGGFLILVLLTRWVSLGSIWGGGCFPFVIAFLYHDVILTILALLCGGLLVAKHHANIKRILKGTESKFTVHHIKESDS